MFQNLKNKVLSTMASYLRPHLAEKTKDEPVATKSEGAKVIQATRTYSDEVRMTSEKAQELLKLSFQRGPEDFLFTKPGQKGFAMDAESPDCHLAQKNMFGLNGAASSVIYTFFAKHGFIGWQLCSLLSQHWLINRACRLPNEDALANGWTLEWQKQDETLDDVKADKRAELLTLAVERGNQSFDLAEKALKFGINRSIYGQALAYFIIEGEDPSTPLNLDGIQPKSFKGIAVVEPYWAFPDWGEDAMQPGSLNFYRPEFYTIGGQRIHRSRLCIKTFVEVPDILKPAYYFGGIPLTQMIYERTYAAEKTANEVPELALTKRMLVADANLQEAMANPQILRQKMEILAYFRNNNGVYFKDRPESVTQLDTNLADLDANVWTQYQLVASVASIPADRLLCTSPKGFQSTGEYERKTYAQTLQSAYQEVAFREFLETALALILKSEFGVADPITLIFNPIDSPTEAERAQTQLVQANRDAALINAGIISAEEAREALAADKGSGYSNLPAEMQKSAEMPDLSDLFGNNEEDKPEGEENGGNGENGAGTDTAADEWKESDHPRDEDGKFSSNAGGNREKHKEKSPEQDRKNIYDAVVFAIEGEPVASLNGNEFQKDGVPLTKKVPLFYKEQYGGKVNHPILGEILLDLEGVKDDLGHGMSSVKAAAFAAVPQVLEKGKIFDEQRNWKGRGYDTYVIVAPVTIGKQRYIEEVVVKRGIRRQGLYLHEVELKEKLEDIFKSSNQRGNPPALEKQKEVFKTANGSTPNASKLIIAEKWLKNKGLNEETR